MGVTIFRPGKQLVMPSPGVTVFSPRASSASFTGILDGISNVAAAYSLRQLRSAYSGSAVRVRRSSDSTEQDIGFVAGEFDSSAFSSFIGGGTGYVKTWYDQGGNAGDVTQTDTAKQPQIVLSDVNSKPSVSFDGGDGLVASNSITYAASNTLVIVARCSALGALFSIGSSTQFDLTNTYAQYAATTVNHTAFASAWSIGSYLRVSLNSKNYKNGGADGTNTSALTSIAGVASAPWVGWRGYLGGGYNFTGKITELIFLTASISTTDHNTIGNDMATRYGLSWVTVT